MRQIDDYMREFAKQSRTKQNEVIVECLDFCGVYGIQDLTLEQVEEFDRNRRKQHGSRIQRERRIEQKQQGRD